MYEFILSLFISFTDSHFCITILWFCRNCSLLKRLLDAFCLWGKFVSICYLLMIYLVYIHAPIYTYSSAHRLFWTRGRRNIFYILYLILPRNQLFEVSQTRSLSFLCIDDYLWNYWSANFLFKNIKLFRNSKYKIY